MDNKNCSATTLQYIFLHRGNHCYLKTVDIYHYEQEYTYRLSFTLSKLLNGDVRFFSSLAMSDMMFTKTVVVLVVFYYKSICFFSFKKRKTLVDVFAVENEALRTIAFKHLGLLSIFQKLKTERTMSKTS